MGDQRDFAADAEQMTIVLLPSFNAHATAAFIDPFRAANYLVGDRLYRWQFCSISGGVVKASNGMGMDTQAFNAIQNRSTLSVVSASWTPEIYQEKKLLQWIRKQARDGSSLCGLDTGAFIFGYAQLLKGYSVTVHYEHIDAFQELFPEVNVTEELFVIDRNILTCCGGGAATDLALNLIQTQQGADLANAAARYIFHDRMRSAAQGQGAAKQEPLGGSVNPKLIAAIRLMEANLESTLRVPDIAKAIDISQRQLERVFMKSTGQSVARYYLDIRLDRARGLITQTKMLVLEVAVACGFASAVHFSKAYKRKFGLSPKQDRVAGRVPFEYRAYPMHGGKRTAR